MANGRPVGWYGTESGSVRESLIEAHRCGMTHWDTADVYGNGESERHIGQIWESVPRQDIFLASKVGWYSGNYDHYYHPKQIRHQLEESLRNLRTDHVDLYYLHHCDFGPHNEYLDDAVATLRAFRDEGKIRFIGLSDWKDERILQFGPHVAPDAIQGYRNVVDDTFESSGLASWATDNDVGVAFFSPLKHGLLLGELEGPATFGIGDHRNAIPEFRDFALLHRLRDCRRRLEQRFQGRSEPLLLALLGALLSSADQSCILLGMRNPRHVQAASKVGECLSEEDAHWVMRLYRDHGRSSRAVWKSAQARS